MTLNKKSQVFSIILTIFSIVMIVAVYMTAKSQINRILGPKDFGENAYNLQKIIMQSYSINSYISSNSKQAFKNAIIDMSLDGGIYNKTDEIYRNATMLFTSRSPNGAGCFNPKDIEREMNYFMGLNLTFLIKKYDTKLLDKSKINFAIINYPIAYLEPFTYLLKINSKGQGNTYTMSSSKDIFFKVYDNTPIEQSYIYPKENPTIPKSIAFCTQKANIDGKNPGACMISATEYPKFMYVIDYLASENIYVTITPIKSNCFIIKQKNSGSYFQKSISSDCMEQSKLRSVLTNDLKDIITKSSNSIYCLK